MRSVIGGSVDGEAEAAVVPSALLRAGCGVAGEEVPGTAVVLRLAAAFFVDTSV